MSTAEERAERAAYMRAWTAKNRERVNAEARERYRSNPKRRVGHGRQALKTHLRKRGGVDAETETMLDVLQRDPCSYCGEPLAPPEQMDRSGVALDHIDAAGDSRWTNLTAACRSCNASKGKLSLLLFLLDRQLRRDVIPVCEQIWLIKDCRSKRRRIELS